jgi:hypothetical protein
VLNQQKMMILINVNNRLSTLANQVGTRADPIQVTVLTKLKGRLQDLAQTNGGVIDANDLYQLRKTGINDVIEAELRSGGLDPSTQSQRIVSLLGEIRPLVDDAIEKAGGKTWRDYLSTYSTGMKQIEQLEMADKLRALFEKDKNEHFIQCGSNEQELVRNKLKELSVESLDLLFIDGWHSINAFYNDWLYTDLLNL